MNPPFIIMVTDSRESQLEYIKFANVINSYFVIIRVVEFENCTSKEQALYPNSQRTLNLPGLQASCQRLPIEK